MVSIQKIFFGKNKYKKDCKFGPFCFLIIKSVLMRRENKKNKLKFPLFNGFLVNIP